MPSTYSPLLKIELIATGEQSGLWGATTDTNLGTAIEEAITAIGAAVFTTDANLTLTLANVNTAQVARCLVLNATSSGSLTATRNLIVPNGAKEYLVWNNTTGGQSIVVKTSAGTGITVASGAKAHLFADGTNVGYAFDYVTLASLQTLTNKTIAYADNTLVGVVGVTATQTLTNKTLDGGTIVTANSASDALRITQLGAGNALVVEDSANPDASPFVVNGTGNVAISQTTALCPLDVNGVTFFRGVKYISQATPIAKTAPGTLTVAELLTGIITYSGVTATLTMPTGSDLDSGLLASLPVNGAFEFAIINLGTTNCTLGAATGVTVVGSAVVQQGSPSSGTFRVRKTATATYIVYRV